MPFARDEEYHNCKTSICFTTLKLCAQWRIYKGTPGGNSSNFFARNSPITNKGGHGQCGQFYATLATIIVT